MSSAKKAHAGHMRRSRITAENRAAMAAILLVVCVLFAVLFLEGLRLKKQIGVNELKRSELQAALDEEDLRTDEIEARREYMQSDEYIRQAARDRLGLVDSGEIIFRQAD